VLGDSSDGLLETVKAACAQPGAQGARCTCPWSDIKLVRASIDFRWSKEGTRDYAFQRLQRRLETDRLDRISGFMTFISPVLLTSIAAILLLWFVAGPSPNGPGSTPILIRRIVLWCGRWPWRSQRLSCGRPRRLWLEGGGIDWGLARKYFVDLRKRPCASASDGGTLC
jgi:hypothetical protein